MKKIVFFLITILLFSCNSEDAGDCFQTAGKIINEEVELDNFTKILIHKRVALKIEEGPEQKVFLETGKNLKNDVVIRVENGQLIAEDNNKCNYVRDFGLTTIHVISPNITEIRNASEQAVTGIGTLTYPNLYLRSTGEGTDFLGIGTFNLTIENESLKIWANANSIFNIKGKTNSLNLNFSDEDPRFNGKDFIAQKATIKHTSSNDVLVNPIQELKGSIHSTGDIISFNKPPIVEVDVQSSYGKLIFK